MKRGLRFVFILIFSLTAAGFSRPASAERIAVEIPPPKTDMSLKLELQHAIDQGLDWLKSVQADEGHWSQPDYPALTGLALTAFMGDPAGKYKGRNLSFIQKGYDYIIRCAKPDGAIYVENLANYNTSVAAMALQLSGNRQYEDLVIKARNHLVGLQQDYDSPDQTDNPFDGGIGYGNSYKHSDMSNTLFALEALYYTSHLKNSVEGSAQEFKELNMAAAIKFIERCQNLPEYNDQDWASDDPQNKGGFVYFPGDSKAGEMDLGDGKKALRSYGSISYAGLLSYIYAQMDRNDPRVKAVHDWLSRNYTLEENPGMGLQGLFYYYHMMAKALSLYGNPQITLADGRSIDWRRDLALRILNLQNPDGYWVNENARWWEKDPVLVTSYAVIILEILHNQL